MRHPLVSWTWLILIGLLLAVIAVSGFRDGIANIDAAETTLQRAFVPVQLVYGVASLAALVALLLRWRRSPIVFAVWGAIITAAATLAPVAWGGTGWGPALSAGVSTAVVCSLLVWGQVRFIRAVGGAPRADGGPTATP